MSRFARLSVVTVAATMVLITLGGFVRSMEAGLGCPDWPTCHGSLNPPSSLGYGALKLAWIEHSHRLMALVVIGLVIALYVAARRTAQLASVRRLTAWLVPAVLSQAVLGAIVVWLNLDAASVMLHLAGALAVLALATLVTLDTTGHRGRATSRLPGLALAVTVGQMLLGSAVTGYEAGLAYATFPDFNGHALPPTLHTAQQWLHFGHRLLAVVVVAVLVALWRATRSRAAGIALVLVGAQVLLGAANIWWRLAAWSVTPHLAVGAALVACLVVVTWSRAPAPTPAPRASALREPVGAG